MKLLLEINRPSFSVWEGGVLKEYGGSAHIKSDDGTLDLMQTWVDSNKDKVVRRLGRIVEIFNLESE